MKINKPWLNLKSPSQRKSVLRSLRERILIICEGEKTEPHYFKKFPVNSGKLEILVHGTGKNTISLVDEAIQRRDKAISDRKDYNQVWCVFDKDSFSDDHFNRAIDKAVKNKIRVAYSNEAFELWYLLHFIYLDTAISRKDYCIRLSEQMGVKYEKNAPDMYKRMKNMQITAIRNAERLYAGYSSTVTFTKRNPSTTVHRLVEELNRFID
ncbi:MAG: RloB domain-containing protein [Candidatus Delongbacteria bacterium]|nr:RloB domain-containing protein [Candidatus Delongbacteria bacterium]